MVRRMAKGIGGRVRVSAVLDTMTSWRPTTKESGLGCAKFSMRGCVESTSPIAGKLGRILQCREERKRAKDHVKFSA